MRYKPLLARGALLLATLIWGSSFVIMKDALDEIHTLFLLAVRFSGACLLLMLLCWRRLRKLTRSCIRAGFVMGTMLTAAYVLQTFGLAETTPGKNAFLTAGYCILVPFFYWFFEGRRPDRYNILAALLGLAGIGLVSLDSELTMGRGDFLTVCCGIFYALHILVSARYTQEGDVVLLTVCQFFFAALWCWGLNLFFGVWPAMQAVSPYTWFVLAYLCVFATAGALCLQMFGLKYTPPAAGALLLSLESVFGVLFSVLLGAEVLTPRLLLGFAVIFTAIVISETKLRFLRGRRG